MSLRNFILAGNVKQARECAARVTPGAIPIISGKEMLGQRIGKLYLYGTYYERPDHDTIIEECRRRGPAGVPVEVVRVFAEGE